MNNVSWTGVPMKNSGARTVPPYRVLTGVVLASADAWVYRLSEFLPMLPA